jgi:hypothetical protein
MAQGAQRALQGQMQGKQKKQFLPRAAGPFGKFNVNLKEKKMP